MNENCIVQLHIEPGVTGKVYRSVRRGVWVSQKSEATRLSKMNALVVAEGLRGHIRGFEITVEEET